MAEENFEALGRYVKAKERASEFDAKRHNVLGELSRLITHTLGKGKYGEAFGGFDAARAADMVKQAQEFDSQMLAAVDEANRHAKAAGKPELKKL